MICIVIKIYFNVNNRQHAVDNKKKKNKSNIKFNKDRVVMYTAKAPVLGQVRPYIWSTLGSDILS